MISLNTYQCRCGNLFTSKQKPLCCPSCLQQKDFVHYVQRGCCLSCQRSMSEEFEGGDKLFCSLHKKYVSESDGCENYD